MRYTLTTYDTLGEHRAEVGRKDALKALRQKDFNAEHTLRALEQNVMDNGGKPLTTNEYGFRLTVLPAQDGPRLAV